LPYPAYLAHPVIIVLAYVLKRFFSQRELLEWKRLQSNEEYFDLEEMIDDEEIPF
jgi:hypothetical protein